MDLCYQEHSHFPAVTCSSFGIACPFHLVLFYYCEGVQLMVSHTQEFKSEFWLNVYDGVCTRHLSQLSQLFKESQGKMTFTFQFFCSIPFSL